MSIWQLVGVLFAMVTFTNVAYLFALKWILQRHQAHLDEKLATTVKAINDKLADVGTAGGRTADRVVDVERQLNEMRLECARDYVRRDDWIRFGGAIDAKLDKLRDALERRTNAEDVNDG